jgi:hypothetical protein
LLPAAFLAQAIMKSPCGAAGCPKTGFDCCAGEWQHFYRGKKIRQVGESFKISEITTTKNVVHKLHKIVTNYALGMTASKFSLFF